MKKILCIILLFCLLCVVSCSNQKYDIDFTRISPNAQIEQLISIYENGSNYIGKTIILKGKYQESAYSNKTYRLCNICDENGEYNYSIEFVTKDNVYPKLNDIFTLSGRIDEYDEEGQLYIQISDAIIK